MKYSLRHLLVIFFISLTSCEYSYSYRYVVNNLADSTISIHLKTYRLDSTYYINSTDKLTIYETDHGVERARGPYFDDVTKDLFECTVKKGTTISSRNYLSNSSWYFEKGEYSTTITNTEF